MLSSVAERVYWLGRYLERIENSARLMDVYSSMLFDLPGTTDIGWGILLDITGERENYAAKEGRIDELPVLKYLIADQSNILFNFQLHETAQGKCQNYPRSDSCRSLGANQRFIPGYQSFYWFQHGPAGQKKSLRYHYFRLPALGWLAVQLHES